MAGAKIALSSTSGELKTDGNDNARVNLPTDTDDAGFAKLLSQVDGGTVTGTPVNRELEASHDYRLRVGVDTQWFNEYFPGSAINSGLWTAPVTTMTATVASGLLTLNAGSSTASGAVARLSTYRSFPCYGTFETYCEVIGFLTQTAQTNNVTEWGLGIATGTTAPSDGAFFRVNAAGELRCVVVNNSNETQSSALSVATYISTNTSKHYVVAIGEDRVNFWIDDVLVARIARTPARGSQTASGMLPVLLRTYNSGITSAAQQLKIGMVTVSIGDVEKSKPWSHVMAGSGGMAYQGQTGGTMGTTASYANSADPTASAALSNTAALVTGLGGQFRFNAAATAVTDGIVTSYQVPAGTAALPGKSLYITGIKISCANLGAAVATTATTLAWSLAFGHTAVSLATAEAATTKAPRRIALGLQTWPVAAAIGQMPQNGDLVMQFTSPIVVAAGEFVATVAKFIVGTATASQVIWGHVTVDGYFE